MRSRYTRCATVEIVNQILCMCVSVCLHIYTMQYCIHLSSYGRPFCHNSLCCCSIFFFNLNFKPFTVSVAVKYILKTKAQNFKCRWQRNSMKPRLLLGTAYVLRITARKFKQHFKMKQVWLTRCSFG